MTGRTIMVQGTMSHVGKTVLVAALCRLFTQDGVRVAPFKAQNMSLNSYVTPQGGEIGRAQAMQAEAAGIEPTVQMNPILLKPEAEHRSQVVVLGRPTVRTSARDYYERKTELWPVVTEALDDLRREYDLVVMEGAGSPAEINLMAHDIVNMRVARHAEAPVVLVGDIERGGVFATLVGTLSLLETQDRALVGALVINKFRGDQSILDPGLRLLEERTGVPVAGVLPYVGDLGIAEEDSLGLERAEPMPADTVLDIAVIRLPYIANFDDFDPLRREPGVLLRYVTALSELGAPDLIILPGTKTTMADLHWLRERGLDRAVIDGHARGTPIVGVCGGYQMLGEGILDPDHVESDQEHAQGLGLLPVTTVFSATKATHQVSALVATAGSGLLQACGGQRLEGYEIHMGRTTGPGVASPFRIVERSGQAVDQPDGATDGAIDAHGRVLGTYIHGLLGNDEFRRAVLLRLAAWKGVTLPEATGEGGSGLGYDGLAALVREHLDMPLIYRLAGLEQGAGSGRLG